MTETFHSVTLPFNTLSITSKYSFFPSRYLYVRHNVRDLLEWGRSNGHRLSVTRCLNKK